MDWSYVFIKDFMNGKVKSSAANELGFSSQRLNKSYFLDARYFLIVNIDADDHQIQMTETLFNALDIIHMNEHDVNTPLVLDFNAPFSIQLGMASSEDIPSPNSSYVEEDKSSTCRKRLQPKHNTRSMLKNRKPDM